MTLSSSIVLQKQVDLMGRLRQGLMQHRRRRLQLALRAWQQNVLTQKFLSSKFTHLSEHATLTRTSTVFAIWRKVYIAQKFQERSYQVCTFLSLFPTRCLLIRP